MRSQKMQLNIMIMLALILMENIILLAFWFSAMFIEEWKEETNHLRFEVRFKNCLPALGEISHTCPFH